MVEHMMMILAKIVLILLGGFFAGTAGSNHVKEPNVMLGMLAFSLIILLIGSFL